AGARAGPGTRRPGRRSPPPRRRAPGRTAALRAAAGGPAAYRLAAPGLARVGPAPGPGSGRAAPGHRVRAPVLPARSRARRAGRGDRAAAAGGGRGGGGPAAGALGLRRHRRAVVPVHARRRRPRTRAPGRLAARAAGREALTALSAAVGATPLFRAPAPARAVLDPRGAALELHPAGHVHTPRARGHDRVVDVLRRQSTGHQDRFGQAAGDLRPVEGAATAA